MDGSTSDQKPRCVAATAAAAATTAQPWRKAVVASSLVAGLALTAIVATPVVITQTSVRNDVLSASFRPCGLKATAGEATGGWIAPLVFRDVQVTDQTGQFQCSIQELQTSRGLLSHVFGSDNQGRITLIGPDVEVHTDDNGNLPKLTHDPSVRTACSYTIEQGRFRLSVPWRKIPIVDVNRLAVSGAIAADDAGERFLTVDAFQLFDHEPLSEIQTEQNLALIAPVLSQSTQLTGSASVWIDEIRVALRADAAAPETPPVSGRAEFHSLEAHLKQDWARQVARLTGQFAKTTVPDRIGVVRDSVVRFSVTAAGIHHDSMVFLLPEIAANLRAESSGMVRLDETLDLSLVVHLSPESLNAVAISGDAPQANPALAMLAQLIREPIRLKVAGTVSKPELQLPEGMAMLDELSRRLAPEQHAAEPPPVSQAVFQLINGVGQPDKEQSAKELPGSIFNLIRAIKAEKDRKPASGKP